MTMHTTMIATTMTMMSRKKRPVVRCLPHVILVIIVVVVVSLVQCVVLVLLLVVCSA